MYGNPEQHPQNEQYVGAVNPIGPRACYDEGKRAAETLFFDYHRQNQVEIRIARIFNTYGPRMDVDDGRVVSNFIVQAIKNDPITIYGDGNQTRSFCYVTDTVEALIKVMNIEDHNGPINIGNPQEITIQELASEIKSLLNAGSEIIKKEMPLDDSMRRLPDIDIAKKV